MIGRRLSPAHAVTLRAMQSPFPSVPLTRFDVVMWFLRVQLWLLVVYLATRLFTPTGFAWPVLVQTISALALPILVLSLFPRVLTLASLGSSAREPLELPTLVGRCVGLSLFVGSLGRVVTFTLGLALNGYRTGSFFLNSGYVSMLLDMQIIGITFQFFLGFALAFGPAIRNSFRAR